MKRNYLYKNTGRLLLATGLLATTLLSSCLKDNSPGTINFGNSPALLGWQYAGFNATPYTAVTLPTGSYTENLEVSLSVASLTLKSAVSATVVSTDTALITAYNSTNGTHYVALPASEFTAPATVTVPAGQQIVNFPVVLSAGTIDFSKPYAIALELTNSSGATIATNLQTAIVIVKVKSQYDDVYTVKSGATTRYNGADVSSGVRDVFTIAEPTIDYTTLNESTVVGQIGSSSFGLTAAITISGSTVTVNANPAATVGSTTFNFVQGNSSGTSSYNAATKELIIHISYLNASGALREIDEDVIGE
jgi:hypothetical protein